MVAENNIPLPDSSLEESVHSIPHMDGMDGMDGMVRHEDQLAMPPHSNLFCTRKQREFTPDSKKDDTYWDRRRRNNAAAKRSREKRRLNDMLLEKRVVQLSRENHILRAQVTSVYKSYGIRAETLIDMDQVMATLPTEDQLLNMTCGTTRPLASPPPTMSLMSLTTPGSSSPQSPPHHFDEVYRGLHQNSYPTPPNLAASRSGSPKSDADIMPPASKRAYLGSWADIEQPSTSTSTASTSSNTSESGHDDPLNLTCKSRSRSSSETEDELQHMPHKLRYKYQQLDIGNGEDC